MQHCVCVCGGGGSHCVRGSTFVLATLLSTLHVLNPHLFQELECEPQISSVLSNSVILNMRRKIRLWEGE
jgi:hypothetical protein